MKSKPLLSIITVNYNNVKGLKRTLESIFTPSLSRVETIVIDGGSTDGSKEIIESFSNKINYWQSKKDSGIYDAMNIGLGKSTGEYIWFLNSGDLVFDSDTISSLVRLLESTEQDIVYGDAMMVDVNYTELGLRSKLQKREVPNPLIFRAFSYGMSISHQSFIVRKSVVPNYNLRYKYVSDIDWILTILNEPRISYYTGFCICKFVNEGYSSKNRMVSNIERFKVLSKHYGVFSNFINHVFIAVRAVT